MRVLRLHHCICSPSAVHVSMAVMPGALHTFTRILSSRSQHSRDTAGFGGISNSHCMILCTACRMLGVSCGTKQAQQQKRVAQQALCDIALPLPAAYRSTCYQTAQGAYHRQARLPHRVLGSPEGILVEQQHIQQHPTAPDVSLLAAVLLWVCVGDHFRGCTHGQHVRIDTFPQLRPSLLQASAAAAMVLGWRCTCGS